MFSLKESFRNNVTQENKLIDQIKKVPNSINSFAYSLRSKNLIKFLYYFFEEKSVKKSKQVLYTAGKCLEFSTIKSDKKLLPSIGGGTIFYLLFSDSKELIDSFKNWEFNNQDYWLTKGALGFVIQEILKDNHKKALELLKVFDDKHKKYPLKEQDSAMLKAIINGNKQEIEKLLKFFLRPENHKKCNDTLMLHSQLFSLHATGFAKLAWIKGIEVKVEHPLLPMELLPIEPNKAYVIEYDFLKSDYRPIINKKEEVPKPKARYRRDKPKNRIGVTKAFVEDVLKDNWEATYTENELSNYTDMIYHAFVNPQQADTKYYDFAKLGNLHISHSNKQFVFIEKKPFTNMWTVLKNETDYFLDLLNSCFDIIGAKLLDNEQYLKIKAHLETNAKNNKGLFGKWFK